MAGQGVPWAPNGAGCQEVSAGHSGVLENMLGAQKSILFYTTAFYSSRAFIWHLKHLNLIPDGQCSPC